MQSYMFIDKTTLLKKTLIKVTNFIKYVYE